jgi:hypothetical protein
MSDSFEAARSQLNSKYCGGQTDKQGDSGIPKTPAPVSHRARTRELIP